MRGAYFMGMLPEDQEQPNPFLDRKFSEFEYPFDKREQLLLPAPKPLVLADGAIREGTFDPESDAKFLRRLKITLDDIPRPQQ